MAAHLVARHIGVSLITSIAALVAGAALLAGAPRHYIATLHATPGAVEIPIAWILETDRIKHDVVTHLDLMRHYGDISEADALRQLKQSTTVVKTVGAAVDVEVADASPDMAASIASAYGRAVYQMTLDQRLSQSATLLYEVRIREAQAITALREAEAILRAPQIAAALPDIPPGWIEFIHSAGPVLAASALNSVGPYQTNGPSETVLEMQRLAVLAAITRQQRERATVPHITDAMVDAIRALQEVSFWKALAAGMREQEALLLDRVKTETATPAVQVPTEDTWTYAITPWAACILLMTGGAMLALVISTATGQRPRRVAQT